MCPHCAELSWLYPILGNCGTPRPRAPKGHNGLTHDASPFQLTPPDNARARARLCGALKASRWPMRLGQLVVTPSFWADTSLLSTALLPLSMLVSAGARLHESVAAAPFVAPCDPPKTPTMHHARRLAHTC